MSIKSKIRDVFLNRQKEKPCSISFGSCGKKALATLTDEEYIRKTYKERYGKDIDLVDPTGFGEKLQWLKLFYRNEKMPICSDKYRVREFLKECGLEHLGNEILGVYRDA